MSFFYIRFHSTPKRNIRFINAHSTAKPNSVQTARLANRQHTMRRSKNGKKYTKINVPISAYCARVCYFKLNIHIFISRFPICCERITKQCSTPSNRNSLIDVPLFLWTVFDRCISFCLFARTFVLNTKINVTIPGISILNSARHCKMNAIHSLRWLIIITEIGFRLKERTWKCITFYLDVIVSKRCQCWWQWAVFCLHIDAFSSLKMVAYINILCVTLIFANEYCRFGWFTRCSQVINHRRLHTGEPYFDFLKMKKLFHSTMNRRRKYSAFSRNWLKCEKNCALSNQITATKFIHILCGTTILNSEWSIIFKQPNSMTEDSQPDWQFQIVASMDIL